MDSHYYTIEVDWKQDRLGILSSSDAIPTTIEVVTPPEFPKGIPGIWSPEHLYVASVGSCFMTTFLAVAENSRLAFDHFSCKAKGKLEQIEGKYIISVIFLKPTVFIKDEKDRERAERVLKKSEMTCLISNSVKSKIEMISNIKRY